MLFRKKSPEESISSLTGKFGLKSGQRKELVSPQLGRWSLKRETSEKAGDYYELNIVGPLAPTYTFSAKRFVYLPEGTLKGVITSEIDPIDKNYHQVESAMQFQIDTGLALPGEEDKSELIEILQSGLKG